MKLLSFPQLKNEIERIGKIIDAPITYLILDSEPEGDGTPHLEIDSKGYHFVVSERGTESKRLTTNDLDELLYWVFQSVTSSMAIRFEFKNRGEKESSRKVIFEKQLELLKKIDPTYSEKRQSEINEILKLYPLDEEEI